MKWPLTNSNISGDNNVEIEDITDQEFSCEIETMIQDFDTVLKRSEEDEISSLQRPSHLNLSGDNTKASYAFNNRIGWLLENGLNDLKNQGTENEQQRSNNEKDELQTLEGFTDLEIETTNNTFELNSPSKHSLPEVGSLLEIDISLRPEPRSLPESTLRKRPSHLNLYGDERKKASYYFNSRIGTCLQLDFWELTFQREKDKRRPSQWSFSAWQKVTNRLLPPPSKFKLRYFKKRSWVFFNHHGPKYFYGTIFVLVLFFGITCFELSC